MDYLLFRLYGPMASWGDIAVGESRHSLRAPTKAAIMGLVAAALGVRREEEHTHLALNQHYAMATAVWSNGQLLRDYHTVQAPDSVGKFRYRTRRDELTVGYERLGTILSAREYRSDALAWVALKADEEAPFGLNALLEALLAPKFTLYLGRKSCPLAAPLAAAIVSAENFHQAFHNYQAGGLSYQHPGLDDFAEPCFNSDGGVDYCWEGEVDAFSSAAAGNASIMQITLHDQLLSRQRWQFTPRTAHCLHIMEDR